MDEHVAESEEIGGLRSESPSGTKGRFVTENSGASGDQSLDGLEVAWAGIQGIR